MGGEQEEMAKTTFRMPKALLKEVKHYGIDHDMSDTQVFIQALTEWMEKTAKKEAERKR